MKKKTNDKIDAVEEIEEVSLKSSETESAKSAKSAECSEFEKSAKSDGSAKSAKLDESAKSDEANGTEEFAKAPLSQAEIEEKAKKAKKNKLISRIMTGAIVVLFLVGAGLFAYPIVLQILFDNHVEKEISEFDKLMQELVDMVYVPEEEPGEGLLDSSLVLSEGDSSVGAAEESDAVEGSVAPEDESSKAPASSLPSGPILDVLNDVMSAYNEGLYTNGQNGLIDQEKHEIPEFSARDYGLKTDLLGYITIPRIEVKLPVYNGASEKNLRKGAAVLAYTSLPLGGFNENCVIAGHTRYEGIHMFKRLTELEVGDEIIITNFWGKLTYRVVETKVVEPLIGEEVYIHPGKTMITLSTCHPYPDNYQRYLVMAELVK